MQLKSWLTKAKSCGCKIDTIYHEMDLVQGCRKAKGRVESLQQKHGAVMVSGFDFNENDISMV